MSFRPSFGIMRLFMTKVRNACILLVVITLISALAFVVISRRDTAKDGAQQDIVVVSPLYAL